MCVELYQTKTILEIYRKTRSSLSRPWGAPPPNAAECRRTSALTPCAVSCLSPFCPMFFSSMPAPRVSRALLSSVSAARLTVHFGQNRRLSCPVHQPHSGAAAAAGIDHFDAFSAKLCTPDPATGEVHRYRKALLFCDNSGADLVLGMIPLARELLLRGTDVVIVANSLPAINDITVPELQGVLQEVSRVDATIRDALQQAQQQAPQTPLSAPRLTVASSGSGSPCLDFRRVSHELCVVAHDADLVVLEGMGRAIHTNLRAEFSCDSVKLAMIKNGRLAKKIFGGKLYDCVFTVRVGWGGEMSALSCLRAGACVGVGGVRVGVDVGLFSSLFSSAQFEEAAAAGAAKPGGSSS